MTRFTGGAALRSSHGAESLAATVEWPLVGAAVIFTVFYAWVVIADLQPPDDALPRLVLGVIWVVFAARSMSSAVVLARPRGDWVRTHRATSPPSSCPACVRCCCGCCGSSHPPW